jgi:type II secretory pathway component PulF
MALYAYKAYSKQGKKVSGYIDSSSQQSAKDQLFQKDLYIISIELAKGKSVALPFYKRIFQSRVKLKDKIFFTKQLGVLLKSGVPLVQALDLLSQQTEGQLRDIVISLRDVIEEGGSLADGLSDYPHIFNNIYIQLIKAGEASGKLDFILQRLTTYLERSDSLRKKIKGALTLPVIQLVVIIVVVFGLLLFVVPTITNTFRKQGATLPLPTRILVGMSETLQNYYILVGAFFVIIPVGIYMWSRTEKVSYRLDQIKLKIPIVKYFARMGAVVQFSNTLGMLLQAGVNLSESLHIVTNIVDNKILTQKLKTAEDKIIKQGKISQYLKQTGLFPPVAIYLINTGEQSGQLDHMLITVARYYEDELSEYSDGLSARLGPIMILLMAMIVGSVILAVVLPMNQMGDVAADRYGVKI